MDVAGQLYHVGIVFHQNALESPLKQMTGPEMPVIEPSGVRDSNHCMALDKLAPLVWSRIW